MKLFNFLKKKSANELESLLKKAADEPAYRMEFYKRLLNEKLFVITKGGELPNGIRYVEKDTMVNILSLEDGRIPVFTSTDRIFDKKIIKEQVHFLELKSEDLFNLVKGATLILNPYSDYGKEILPTEIENLLHGVFPHGEPTSVEIKKSTTIIIGQPAKYPTQIVKSLSELFSKKANVHTAYLGWIHYPSTNEPPHYIFAIDADGDWNTLVKEAGFITREILRSDEIVDFIRMENSGGLSDYFIKQTTPFYKE